MIAEDIRAVIRALCQGAPSDQEAALGSYFLPNASFTHPFCRVPSFSQLQLPLIGPLESRQLILAIYRWYRMLSPRISDLSIDSCGMDCPPSVSALKSLHA